MSGAVMDAVPSISDEHRAEVGINAQGEVVLSLGSVNALQRYPLTVHAARWLADALVEAAALAQQLNSPRQGVS